MTFEALPTDIQAKILDMASHKEELEKVKAELACLKEAAKNPYFLGIMRLAQEKRAVAGSKWFFAADPYIAAGTFNLNEDDDDDESIDSETFDYDEYIRSFMRSHEEQHYDKVCRMSHAEKVSIIPALCSSGLWVGEYPEPYLGHSMIIYHAEPSEDDRAGWTLTRCVKVHSATNAAA